MGTKAAVAEAISGSIAAGAYTFEISDPTTYKTVKIDGLQSGDKFDLVRENFGADGWEPSTDGRGNIQLNTDRRTATPLEIGVYSVVGSSAGDVTIWTEEMA